MRLGLTKAEKKFLMNKYRSEGLKKENIKEKIKEVSTTVHKTLLVSNKNEKNNYNRKEKMLEQLYS